MYTRLFKICCHPKLRQLCTLIKWFWTIGELKLALIFYMPLSVDKNKKRGKTSINLFSYNLIKAGSLVIQEPHSHTYCLGNTCLLQLTNFNYRSCYVTKNYNKTTKSYSLDRETDLYILNFEKKQRNCTCIM